MDASLQSWLISALKSISAALNAAELEELRVKFMGKKGFLTLKLKELSSLEIEQRKIAGNHLNQLKNSILSALNTKKLELSANINPEPNKKLFDITLSARVKGSGSLHPITQITAELEKIFSDLGFVLAEGPEIEDELHNFTALNFPESHPARDSHDTFYFGDGMLLRTHTSTVQIRALSELSKSKLIENSMPIRLIAPGRVYRCDYDLTHTPMFHQIEGLMVGENINFANLKAMLSGFLQAFFNQENLKFRFRPSFFPFTEPSAEMDMSCVNCIDNDSINCRVCKGTGWLEILGCGMIHPNVLNFCQINPDKYSGWAFGIGLDRLAMLKYKIPDLRLMFENDLKFLQQFS